jgi:hypothetical protein
MTSELSETQRQILATAAQRTGLVLPVTSKLKGGALKKVLSALLTRGAIEEVPANGEQEVWRKNDEGVALTLKLTKAPHPASGSKRKPPAKQQAKEAPRRERGNTKQAKVIAMLNRPGAQPSIRLSRRPAGSRTRSEVSSPERLRSGSASRSSPTRPTAASGSTA